MSGPGVLSPTSAVGEGEKEPEWGVSSIRPPRAAARAPFDNSANRPVKSHSEGRTIGDGGVGEVERGGGG